MLACSYKVLSPLSRSEYTGFVFLVYMDSTSTFYAQPQERKKMQYGKRLRREIKTSFPEWEGKFIGYKKLKKQLKLINPWSKGRQKNSNGNNNNTWSRFAARGYLDVNPARRSIVFTQALASELDKVETFYFDKEEDSIIRLKELKIRAANLKSNEEKLDVQKDILDFHAEMVYLLHYSVLNFTGLIKIVKKHNKKTGTSFQFSSMPRDIQQSFFSADWLYKLMEECEALLCRLILSDEAQPHPKA